jgi:hypothetical protein
MKLWKIRAQEIDIGPTRTPFTITATPIIRIGIPIEQYLLQLSTTLRVSLREAAKTYFIKLYGRRDAYRYMPSNREIEEMGVFIFPTSIIHHGTEMRRASGGVKIKDIKPSIFEEVLEEVQSQEEGDIADYKWTALLNQSSLRNYANRGRGGDGN